MTAKEHPVSAHEQRFETIEGTLDNHDDRLRVIEQAGAVREEKISALWIAVGKIERSVEMIQAAVTDIKQKPAKRWEQAVGYLIGALIAGAVGYILGVKP
jgi:hypothetical protein